MCALKRIKRAPHFPWKYTFHGKRMSLALFLFKISVPGSLDVRSSLAPNQMFLLHDHCWKGGSHPPVPAELTLCTKTHLPKTDDITNLFSCRSFFDLHGSWNYWNKLPSIMGASSTCPPHLALTKTRFCDGKTERKSRFRMNLPVTGL